jgi:hypothetical protein
MTRLIAAVLVISCALALVTAQGLGGPGGSGSPSPFGSQRSSTPFQVVERDGKSAWKVSGRGNVKVEDLLGAFATATGVRVHYTQEASRQLSSNVQYISSDNGIEILNDEIPNYVNDLLEGANLAIVGFSTGQARLVTVNEARSWAVPARPDALDALPRTEWASVRMQLEHADATAILRMLGTAGMRQPVQTPVGGNAFLLIGPVGQMRNAITTIAALDEPGAGTRGDVVRSYNVPEGMNANAVATSLSTLFSPPQATVRDLEGRLVVQERRAHVASIVAVGDKLLVRASGSDQQLVEAALNALR